MRFGVAQMRGYAYHELIEFMQREGRPPDRAELDTLREVYIFYDPDMIEIDPSIRAASIALLEHVRKSRERPRARRSAPSRHARRIRRGRAFS